MHVRAGGNGLDAGAGGQGEDGGGGGGEGQGGDDQVSVVPLILFRLASNNQKKTASAALAR